MPLIRLRVILTGYGPGPKSYAVSICEVPSWQKRKGDTKRQGCVDFHYELLHRLHNPSLATHSTVAGSTLQHDSPKVDMACIAYNVFCSMHCEILCMMKSDPSLFWAASRRRN